MKAKLMCIVFLAQALILMAIVLGPVGPLGEMPALAQPAVAGETPARDPNAPSVDIIPTLSYQGRLVESGVPVTGDRQMTFRLYDDATEGNVWWTEGPKTVPVSNGLFTVTLGDTVLLDVNDFSQRLYLEIQVGTTILPRQVLQGSPYALSLAPGADVIGTTGESLLYSGNSGWGEGVSGYSYSGNGVAGSSYTGHGMYAEGYGNGLGGSALYAKSISEGGIALRAQNASLANNDAAIVVENNGMGDLLKGFGSDSGEDEFRFKNDGTFQNKQPSYIFIPGSNAYFDYQGGADVTFERWDGAVYIYSSTTGYKNICLSATLPSVLYGQPVEVEQVRIYYNSVQSSVNFITSTYVKLINQSGSADILISDPTDYSSMAYTSYNEYPNVVLSADLGILSICWNMSFTDVTHPIYLGGVRLMLRHHPGY